MSIVDLFYPKLCMGCGREGKYICEECWDRIGRGESRVMRVEGLEGLVAPYRYKGVLQQALKKVKYKSAWEVVEDIAEKWIRQVLSYNLQFTKTETVVTSVPMFKKKGRERGFNQAEVLAKKLAEVSGLEYRVLLARTRETKPQYGMKREEREKNIEGAFEWMGGKRVPSQVLLVDDVWTTGSTMRECARVLKTSGAGEVWGLVLAS